MRKVGFHGGHTVYEIGPASDLVVFFKCLSTCVAQSDPKTDYSLLSDRLYRRYLRQDELTLATALLERARAAMSRVQSTTVDWEEMGRNESETQLNTDLPILSDVFRQYFDGISKAVGSALSFYETFKIFQPVKAVISDMPDFIVDDMRPLAEYDALDGSPFWLR